MADGGSLPSTMTTQELEEMISRVAQASCQTPGLLHEQAKFIIAMEGDEVLRQIASIQPGQAK